MTSKSKKLSEQERASAEELLSQSSDLVAKENELINHRLNWGLLFQGLLFASIFIGSGSVTNFIVLSEVSDHGHSLQTSEALSVINAANWFIAPVGMLSCWSIYLGTLFAHYVIQREIALQDKLRDILGRPISGAKRYHWALTQMAPHFAIPMVGCLTWVALAVQGYKHLFDNLVLGLVAGAVWLASIALVILSIVLIRKGRATDGGIEKDEREGLEKSLEDAVEV